ncbi:MAG: hypothetical protein PF505_13500 [Vallitaleaceae bacterium]|jgi:hypothetical protein|nr:hypothetical protein [Vallitaleaceae bacterium]
MSEMDNVIPIGVHITRFMNDMGIDDFDDIGFLYQDYIFECIDLVESISNMMLTAAPAEVEKLIHNFKGVSANLYVDPVYSLLLVLDNYLLSHSLDQKTDQEANDLWQEIKRTFARACIDIVAFFATNGVSLELNR